MKLKWHDSAIAEFEEAALYYGAIDDELGERFVSATEIAIAQIKARPAQAWKFDGRARKVRVQRFPYAVVYWIDGDAIRIVSVMNLHREPGYWHGRLSE